MKPSEFRKIYLASTRLYGFILSPDLFKLLKHYNIKFTKDEVYKDLETRVGKLTNGYYVAKGKTKQYIVANSFVDEKIFHKLAEAKQGKPYYYPESFEKFLNYANQLYYDDEDAEAFSNLRRFIKANVEVDETEVNSITHMLIEMFKNESFTEVFSIFELFNINFKNEKALKKFVGISQKYVNNLRTPYNNGFTPNEMRIMMGPIDINKVQLTIGPNMRKSMLEGITDPFEMLNELDKQDIPIMAKESLRKELLDIIQELNRTPKA